MGTQVKKPKAYSYIRLSTALQRKGHGRQRQFDKSAAYAAANNLDLVSDPLEDIGISAYKGKNVTEGVLGQFIEAARAGKVERGSYLLVESLDRLSRQQVETALETFLGILRAGITIVTLGDGDRRTYVPGQVNVSDLVMTIMIMGRAHEESQTKADRIRANWANKRTNARVHPMTAMCPAWLQLSKDRKSYREIEKRSETVRWIFDQAGSGMGVFAITKRLNEQKVPHFGRSDGWHQSYVVKILKNPAAMGAFQPHKLVNDRREPEGDLIEGYFPAVVSEDVFNRVQYGMAQRRTNGAGRKGRGYSNLFSGLPLRCAHCEGTVIFENKGSGPKGGHYLVCDKTRRGLDCPSQRWRYGHFEASVLYFLSKQIDLPSIVQGAREGDRRYVLDNAIEVLEAKRHELQARQQSRVKLLDTMPDAIDVVAKGLKEIKAELTGVEARLKELTEQRTDLINEADAMAGTDIKALVESLGAASEEDRYKVRSDLSSNLKKLASRIDVGFAMSEESVRAVLKVAGGTYDEQEIQELVYGAAEPSFEVTFKNGRKEISHPSMDDAFDPAALEWREMMEKLESSGYDTTDPDKALEEFMEHAMLRRKVIEKLEREGYDLSDPNTSIDELVKHSIARSKKRIRRHPQNDSAG